MPLPAMVMSEQVHQWACQQEEVGIACVKRVRCLVSSNTGQRGL